LLELAEYGPKNSPGGKRLLCSSFVVHQSIPTNGAQPHGIGDQVDHAWRLTGNKEAWQDDREKGKARVFVPVLLGLPAAAPNDMIKKAASDLASPAQPGRGILVWAIAQNTSRNAAKPFVEIVAWEHVKDQKPADIAARRARQERKEPPAGAPVTATQAQSAPAQTVPVTQSAPAPIGLLASLMGGSS
jgi:hypothetical protein